MKVLVFMMKLFRPRDESKAKVNKVFGHIKKMILKDRADRKSFWREALSIGVAFGGLIPVMPSGSYAESNLDEAVISGGRSGFECARENLSINEQIHEKEEERHHSSGFSFSTKSISDTLSLYKGVDKAIKLHELLSLKAEVENQRQAYERAFDQEGGLRDLESSLSEIFPENVKTPEEQAPLLTLSPTYQATKEQYEKTDKVASQILLSYEKTHLVAKGSVTPKAVKQLSHWMNGAYQQARSQGLTPSESWIKVGMLAYEKIEGRLEGVPQRSFAPVMGMGALYAINNPQVANYLARMVGPMVSAGLIAKAAYHHLAAYFSKEDSGSKGTTLSQPIPDESKPKVLSTPIHEENLALKGFDIPEKDLVDIGKVLIYVQESMKADILSYPGSTMDPKEGMILMRENGEYRGGRHKDLDRKPDIDRHHMPADSTTSIKYNDGPSIQMERKDHKITSSHGSSNVAKEYREEIRELMNSGRGRDAMTKEVMDIKSKFGTKYNEPMKEMLQYAKTLDQFKK